MKDPSPILVSCVGIIKLPERLLQPRKASTPMPKTLSVIVNEPEKPLQFWNALTPTPVRDVGKFNSPMKL